MPRTDANYTRIAIRAYHRASAALRDLHREEWEVLRAQFLEIDPNTDLPTGPGPARGRKPLVTPYRKATSSDIDDARRAVAAALKKTKVTEKTVIDALTKNGFLLMRATR